MLNVPPSRMVEQVSQNVRDPSHRGFSIAWIGDRLNEAKRRIANAIRQAQANFFKKQATVNVTVGVEEYDLPLDMPPDGLTGVEPLYTSYARSRYYISYRERNKVITGAEKHFSAYHDGRRNRLVLKPTPTEAETVTVIYQRSSIEMQYGNPDSMTANTIQLPLTPTMGRQYLAENYPVGAFCLISGGSALGDMRQITSYAVATRLATVDAAWTAFSSFANMQYEILPDWVDDDISDYLVYDATMTAFDRDEEESARWEKKRDEKYESIIAEVKQLQKVQAYRMVLDREWGRAGRRVLPPGIRIP